MASSPKNVPAGTRRRAPLVARRPGSASSGSGGGASPAAPPKEPPGLSDSDGRWVSQAEAAREAGVTPATVRRWRKAGTIAERRSPADPATIEVFLSADRHRPVAAEGDVTAAGDHGSEPQSELGVLVPLEIHQRSLAELILRLTDTTERAVRAEAKVEMLEAKLAELQGPPGAPAGTLDPPPPPRRKKR